MKGNGTKVFFIVAFLAMTIYYLFPSIQFWLEERYIDGLPEEERQAYLEENQDRLEDLRARTLSLGLDLQGGMHVTLDLNIEDLIRELARDHIDEEFEQVLGEAARNAREQNLDMIEEFVEEFERHDPNVRLTRYFRARADEITRESTNDDVLSYLESQREEAVGRALEIVRERVDRFGVTEPSIMRQGDHRIIVEMPGVEDQERVRELLSGTARLEFRTTPAEAELRRALEDIVAYFDEETDDPDEVDIQPRDPQAMDEQDNPLLQVLMPMGQRVDFGYAAADDTSRVNELLSRDAVRQMLPRDTELLWTASPQMERQGEELYALVGVRRTVEMTGEVITDARPDFDQNTNRPKVSMTMNRQGSRTWSRVTGANVGQPVAIVLDGMVYSYPDVRSQITGGRSEITGLDSIQEAEDLVNILLSGALPTSLDIVEERTVGPSLGEESIRSGFNSAMTGLVVVAIFMILYYRQGGAIADLALVLNIIFILGILSAFNATLTLPGIAGIVLTIGMAVDANVLIFDRIREEQRVGKSLVAAIDSGYANAMSAIFDANITTFLTAVILFSFGVGPIKGFAVTLMAGIAASLFSAIIITRVIVDFLTKERSYNISFG